ncbi:PREDICTED: thymus-specific serine protease [Chrysochloris asiatica]|uniref:Thymus-specific serine protease n=1 Tax=Chrysochloris asiatica TaxID=185453 RepID=A0A9B0WWR8_CHRAS|nr:PREDICTED: thymus-specific serine protease [Chrysochloris asiatica]
MFRNAECDVKKLLHLIAAEEKGDPKQCEVGKKDFHFLYPQDARLTDNWAQGDSHTTCPIVSLSSARAQSAECLLSSAGSPEQVNKCLGISPRFPYLVLARFRTLYSDHAFEEELSPEVSGIEFKVKGPATSVRLVCTRKIKKPILIFMFYTSLFLTPGGEGGIETKRKTLTLAEMDFVPQLEISLLRRLGEHTQQLMESSEQSLGLKLGPGDVSLPKEGWLEQPLDPFNASDRRVFLQRYWVNDQYWTGQNGPIFLHLGGEGSLGPGSVMRGHPASLAPALGALVVGLEHRFYGLSIPAAGLDMAQLRFLSSRHALADMASAHLALSRIFNVSSSSRWICFGGSYAGSLAAWARLKFPHLIFASVASSAPLRAVLDFSEYNAVVSRSLMRTAIGGSLECRTAASAAFAEVGRRLRAGGAAQAALRAELGACSPLSRTEDQAMLLEALQALVGGTVQYDGQVGAPLSVRQLCGLLADGGNRSRTAPYRGLRRAVQIVMHSLGQRCLSTSRAETVAQLRDTEPQVSNFGDRQWLYQTCTEFGFYVTCEDPDCPFSQLPALPSQLGLCEQVFGLSASSVAQAVAQTNSYYGGQTPRATQVLFVNGDADPWHMLSVTQSLGPFESALLIPNASHCLDMAPERPSDSPSLRLARQEIFQQLQTWLRLANESQGRDGA